MSALKTRMGIDIDVWEVYGRCMGGVWEEVYGRRMGGVWEVYGRGVWEAHGRPKFVKK